MARQKTEKKLISFVKSDLINRLVKDEAEKENRSESSIIEQTILDSFLPKNKNARCIIETYLYTDEGSIGNTLAALFSYNAAGTNWASVHDNFLPLVKFAKSQEVFCNTTLSGKEDELYHCYSQIESIIDKLERVAVDDSEHEKDYLREADWARHLLHELKEEPQCSHLINFYVLILNNWEDLKGWSITYRLLMDLAILEKGWRNDYETRTELLELVKVISAEWNES